MSKDTQHWEEAQKAREEYEKQREAELKRKEEEQKKQEQEDKDKALRKYIEEYQNNKHDNLTLTITKYGPNCIDEDFTVDSQDDDVYPAHCTSVLEDTIDQDYGLELMGVIPQ